MPGKEKPLLLVSPLDWGLGHTTRIIPLIRYLLYHGCDIVVACNSTQSRLLGIEFPGLRFVELEGYNIRYSRNMTSTRLRLLLQAPNILTKIKQEELWFLRFLAKNRVDAVISDNRYGLRAVGIPSILLTHQLALRTGFGRLADAMATRTVRRFINRFTECWIPDVKEEKGFAGLLSHPGRLPAIPTRYIGCLSRFVPCAPPSAAVGQDNILVVLSGPEPQRTALEEKIVAELRAGLHSKVTLVRGLPGADRPLPAIDGATIIDHAGAEQLNRLMCDASLVISRAGYTSVMDALALKKRMLLIPTPGQGEQEYLGKHLSETGIAPVLQQQQFSLAGALRLSASFAYAFPDIALQDYETALNELIASLPSS